MTENKLPDFLTHYYEASSGPFRSLSDLSIIEAEKIQAEIRTASNRFASQRSIDYITIRNTLETHIRNLFIEKGGKPIRNRPHYLILGTCDWVKNWYLDGRVITLPLKLFDLDVISFTYGDSFPTMRFNDGCPYRGQVYTLVELPMLISMYGLPQVWNADGKRGPERYIEAQVWDDAVIMSTLNK